MKVVVAIVLRGCVRDVCACVYACVWHCVCVCVCVCVCEECLAGAFREGTAGFLRTLGKFLYRGSVGCVSHRPVRAVRLALLKRDSNF